MTAERIRLRRRRSTQGFTLLEVVVALVIAALALIGLFRAGSGGLFASETAVRVDEAIERAQSHLAAFGRTGAVTPGDMEGDDGGGYRWRVRVEPIAGEPTNVVPWHFDKHYWSTATSDRMLTAFIPFHDCGEEMGTITMVDGSHRWREVGRDDSMTRHFAERDGIDLERVLAENAAYNSAGVLKVPMVIPKGHMSFHHCRTYHGSLTNRSPRPRRAVSFHLQDGENAYREYVLSTNSR